jgi:endonuclease/exonuclease/phosphatase family metal-dependent hydrolase
MYGHRKMGYRLDHILVRGLGVLDCDYRHDLRERGLSDHSAIWADLEVGTV